MENQLTNNANALRLFFTEDVFLVQDNSVIMPPVDVVKPVLEAAGIPSIEAKINVIEAKEPVSIAVVPSDATPAYIENSVKTSIVEEPVAQSKSFKFLGGNKKSVLILVNDNVNDVSTEQGRELLRKIVKAVDLAAPDFALLNYATYTGADFAELDEFFKPQLMLAFGVEANHLKLNLTWQNQIITFESTRMIFAPNLHDLDADITAKKLLWANLQLIK
ncbi:hypothetical protein [Pedobacter aquatilis]|uniref:hypothetical protein n=1 Tax=Pedobacter aquatilis TaxID=351343 RepID=UPI0029304D01|nr:hypothetical protein [Pedobacter aquatilis]